MASEDEVDIEGDLDATACASPGASHETFEDFTYFQSNNDLYQKNIKHPWSLDQGWSMEQYSDDNSKNVVEKMLLEEQQYFSQGGSVLPQRKSPPFTHRDLFKSKIAHNKRSWTQEEKELFKNAFEIFGNKWKKVAEIIPGRTYDQVRNYGQKYMIDLIKETQQHTNSTTKQLNSPESGAPKKNMKTNTSVDKKPLQHNCETTNTKQSEKINKFPDAQIVRMTMKADSDSEEIDIEDEDIESAHEKPILMSRDVVSSESIEYKDNDITKTASKASTSGGKNQNYTTVTTSEDDVLKPHLNLAFPELQPVKDSDIACDEEHCSASHLGATDKSEHKISADYSKIKADSISSSVTNSDFDTVTQKCEHWEGRNEFCNSVLQNTEGGTTPDTEENTTVFPVIGSNGKVFYLSNPTEECTLSLEEIIQQEKEVFSEFFDGRKYKCAEKYAEIRNCILTLWEKTKPKYLFKTHMRQLKKLKCDVNLLGRIHSYLEQIGAINFGCEQAQYRMKKQRHTMVSKRGLEPLSNYNREALNKRRRKVRDMFGTWTDGTDAKNIEGKTIDHDANEVSVEVVKRKKKLQTSSYDPFKLIPCLEFGNMFQAPFNVEIDVTALTMMDVHSHLSKTEVIGLLGGKYVRKSRILQILVAEPCESLSTGMQCEMDPVSQTEASERIIDDELKVLGWYHSHPTFEPNPSVRDIETQETFQTWFSSDGNPFVGIIVSPYYHLTPPFVSLIRCLMTSRHNKQCSNLGLPFQFNHKVIHNDRSLSTLLEKVQVLLSKSIHSSEKVEMFSYIKQGLELTCVQKLCKSVGQYFDAAQFSEEKELFLENLSKLIKQYYSVT